MSRVQVQFKLFIFKLKIWSSHFWVIYIYIYIHTKYIRMYKYTNLNMLLKLLYTYISMVFNISKILLLKLTLPNSKLNI